LGFPIYKGQATASPITDTQFVVLTVRHTEPEKAALIANGLINVLIDENEQLQAIRYISAEQNLQNRIDETQQQISLLENKLTNFQQPPLSLSSRVSKSKSWKHKAK